MNPITYNTTGSFTYTVPVTGTYTITAAGAAGGSATGFNVGGSGAEITATFNFTQGQQLFIIVGDVGANGVNNPGGGGGSTGIYTGPVNNPVPLLIAGGGGGGGGNGRTTDGGAGIGAPGALGDGGAGGGAVGGGAIGSGGGGAGANSSGGNGRTDTPSGNIGGGGGQDLANGSTGGTGGASNPGGFGGGGGGGTGGGGGGGGAIGGAGGGGNGGGFGGGRGGTSYLDTARGTLTSSQDGANAAGGRVLIAAPAPCYVTGTRIRARCGLMIQDVPVETLRVGDLVVTAAGKPRPIRWIGSRSYPGLTAPKQDRPVRVRAGALSDGIPARDLLVSPDHCLWLDGLLVAAGHLVNGTSITRGEAVADLTYWHVELDSHDLLMAENTPAESFLATPGVRGQFDGSPRSDAASSPVPCAVRVERGEPALDALRERLILRAGLSVAPTRFGAVRGWLDRCDGRRVAGWAQDAAHPDGPVCLDIVVDGAVVAMTLAEEYRADIAAAGVGDGCHGFDVDLDEPLMLDEPLTLGEAHTVEVRRSVDGLRVCAMALDATGVWTPLLAA